MIGVDLVTFYIGFRRGRSYVRCVCLDETYAPRGCFQNYTVAFTFCEQCSGHTLGVLFIDGDFCYFMACLMAVFFFLL